MGSLRKIIADYISGVDAPRNYIREGNFDHGVKGFSTYKESDSVTFTITTDQVGLTAHNLFVGQLISFTAIAGGTTGIAVDTGYYVVLIVDANNFKIAATKGGAVIDLATSDGTGTLVRDRPKLGTGGSPNITLTRVTSNSLKGNASGLLTKQAANRMGEGFSYTFTIDRKHKAKVLYQQFLYEVASGAYTDSEISAYVYGPIDGSPVVTELSPKCLKNSSLIEQFDSAFQTALVGSQYRLCLHISLPDVVAYTMRFDEFKSVEKRGIKNSIVSDWITYNAPISASPTPPTYGTIVVNNAKWRRVGDSMEIKFDFQQSSAGTAGSGNYIFPLPQGYSIDMVKFINSGFTNVGSGLAFNSVATGTGSPIIYNATNFLFEVTSGGNANGGLQSISNGYFSLADASAVYSFTALVPIVGWGATTEVFGDAETRVVTARASISGTPAITSGSPVLWNVVNYDSHGRFDVLTGKYTIGSPGKYHVKSSIYTGGATNIYIRKNGTIISQGSPAGASTPGQVFDELDLVAGDEITITPDATTTLTQDILNNLSVCKVSGPSQIAIGEKIVALAGLSGSYAYTANTPIVFDQRLRDSHNGLNISTGEFTCPAPGDYLVSGYAQNQTGTQSSMSIWKSGVSQRDISTCASGGNNSYNGTSILPDCKAGDVITLRLNTSVTLSSGASMSICKL